MDKDFPIHPNNPTRTPRLLKISNPLLLGWGISFIFLKDDNGLLA
jgi:hypothetical protein